MVLTLATAVHPLRGGTKGCGGNNPQEGLYVRLGPTIEEGLKQKTRQNVIVLDWGSRSNAALGNFGVKV